MALRGRFYCRGFSKSSLIFAVATAPDSDNNALVCDNDHHVDAALVSNDDNDDDDGNDDDEDAIVIAGPEAIEAACLAHRKARVCDGSEPFKRF
ncbi:hypothetical protein PoB_007674300 [Plakobranchus ocellatus]|uniref:Secreted protein n=1 Tax=Plakobranchus ocellatus TaxID=259542 RepID=A0AAV4E103_9GAST|nr:hypothetical protein PoB_007674300 [Plakobranchus ocellatus]